MAANESLGGAENGDDDDDEESVVEEIIHCEIQIDETAVKSNEDDAKDENTKFEIDEVASLTPSDYDDQAHLFHMNILNESMVNLIVADQRERPKRYKNGTRKSLTFTNVQMREIERQNQILVRKIFTHSAPPSTSTISKTTKRESNSAVNRKKQQRQISLENEVLVRKIKQISARKKKIYE